MTNINANYANNSNDQGIKMTELDPASNALDINCNSDDNYKTLVEKKMIIPQKGHFNPYLEENIEIVKNKIISPPSKTLMNLFTIPITDPSLPPLINSNFSTSSPSSPSLPSPFSMKFSATENYSKQNKKLAGINPKLSKFYKNFKFTPIQKSLLDPLQKHHDIMIIGDHLIDYTFLSLYIINYILNSNTRIIQNNRKLKKNPSLDIRDQGFTKPKILILLPFRNQAYEFVREIVKIFKSLDIKNNIKNQRKFNQEFKLFDMEGQVVNENANPNKPFDYNETFRGNIDDCFKFGIEFNENSLKLFSDFYQSDIIVASPLGLFLAINGEKGTKSSSSKKSKNNKDNDQDEDSENDYNDQNYKNHENFKNKRKRKNLSLNPKTKEEKGKGKRDKKRKIRGDYDFLSSIEICLIDKCNVILMQNWDHLKNIFTENEHEMEMKETRMEMGIETEMGMQVNKNKNKMGDYVNSIPKEAHGCDFSRLLTLFMDNLGSRVRQNILVSKFIFPELNQLFQDVLGGNCLGQCIVEPESFSHFVPLTLIDTFNDSNLGIHNSNSNFKNSNSNSLVDIQNSSINNQNSNSSVSLPSLSILSKSPLLSFSPSLDKQTISKIKFYNIGSFLGAGKGNSGITLENQHSIRLKFLFERILPMFPTEDRICIFIPSYFDLVQIKYEFQKETFHIFRTLSEYDSEGHLRRSKSDFHQNKARILLVTERFHFFKRRKLDGIGKLIFYSIPENIEHVQEWIKMISIEEGVKGKKGKQEKKGKNSNKNNNEKSGGILQNDNIHILYSFLDYLKLERLVGTKYINKF